MYFSQIRVDPNNSDTSSTSAASARRKSTDGGKTWSGLNNMGHVDNHAIWINPAQQQARDVRQRRRGRRVVRRRRDVGIGAHAGPCGLSYHASVDMRRPYCVCTGLQDNGSWCGPSSVRNGGGIRQWNWISVGGGDGFQSQIDPTDPNIFYTESQNGSINRYDLNTGESRNIQPNAGVARRRGGGGGGGARWRRCRGGRECGRSREHPQPDPGRDDPVQLEHRRSGSRRTIPAPSSSVDVRVFISRDRGDTWTMTKELGKGINLDERSIMGVSYAAAGADAAAARRHAGPACRASSRRTTATSRTNSARSPNWPNRP